MNDSSKTKEQLIAENADLRREIAHLQDGNSRQGNYKLTCEERDRILAQIGIIVFIWEAKENWPVGYVSPNITQFGYTPEDFYQNRTLFSQFIHPDDLERVAAEVAHYSEKACQEFDQMYRILTVDGTVKWVEDHTIVKRDQNGIITHYQGIVFDVTERKKTETALIESEMRYRQMFEAHPAIQWLVDPETQKLVDANPAAAQFYGYSREEMRHMFVAELNVLSPDEIKAKMIQAQSKKRTYFEVPHRLASGEMRLVEIHAAPIHTGGRQLLYAVLHDITERKAATGELRRTNRELALLNKLWEGLNSSLELDKVLTRLLEEICFVLGAVAGSIWLVDQSTNDLVCRQVTDPHSQVLRGWRLAYGQGIAGLVAVNGRSLNIADAHSDERHFKGVDQKTGLATRSLLCVPLKIKQNVIGVIQVMDSATAHFNQADLSLMETLANTAAVAVENARLHEQLADHVTELERRIAQRTQDLVVANNQLKELDRLKTKLIEDISHELRTPVANLSLYLDLLERGKPEKRDHYMVVLRDKMQHLIRLTEDVLQVFRLDLFKGDVVFQALDLNQIVSDVVVSHQLRIEESALQLAMVLAQRPLPILAEKKQIERIITNLLLNAINYTPSGSIHIRTELHATQNEVCISIQDTGLGIVPEDKPHIFDRFYRGYNATQYNSPGTGLGLSVVQDVVALHNGRIEVDSEPGQGSIFRVWLPLDKLRIANADG